MKILLLNDNPVVSKLVTLSAQKTSDELDIIDSVDEIVSSQYDLLIVDDTKYDATLMEALAQKVQYKKSLYIHAKNAEVVSSFSATLKKPFLPTDLVELFVNIEKETQNIAMPNREDNEEISLDDALDFEEDEDDEIVLDDEITLDDELDFNDDEEISLEDTLNLSEDEDEDVGETVLDEGEVQEVQSLLDEAETEDVLNIEEELDLDTEASDTLDLEEEKELDSIIDEELEEDTLELESDESDENLHEDTILDDEENLEEQIESAVSALTPEELESEVDKETLLDIVKNEIDGIDALTSRDLKLAIGEDISDMQEESIEEVIEESQDAVDIESEELVESPQVEDSVHQEDGVESLKKLLQALSDKDIAAAMNGMKIEIKITLGEH